MPTIIGTCLVPIGCCKWAGTHDVDMGTGSLGEGISLHLSHGNGRMILEAINAEGIVLATYSCLDNRFSASAVSTFTLVSKAAGVQCSDTITLDPALAGTLCLGTGTGGICFDPLNVPQILYMTIYRLPGGLDDCPCLDKVSLPLIFNHTSQAWEGTRAVPECQNDPSVPSLTVSIGCNTEFAFLGCPDNITFDITCVDLAEPGPGSDGLFSGPIGTGNIKTCDPWYFDLTFNVLNTYDACCAGPVRVVITE